MHGTKSSTTDNNMCLNATEMFAQKIICFSYLPQLRFRERSISGCPQTVLNIFKNKLVLTKCDMYMCMYVCSKLCIIGYLNVTTLNISVLSPYKISIPPKS